MGNTTSNTTSNSALTTTSRGTVTRKNGSFGPGGGSSGGVNTVTSLGEAMSQAENLRRELLRVQAGITLLYQSVDRLSENVVVDNIW
jgi:hypothetical protein